MSVNFVYGGGIVQMSAAERISPDLEAETYVVDSNAVIGMHLKQTENLTLPSKLYGDATKNLTRLINTFKKRKSSTGVLLSGDKGSGKTMLCKGISQFCRADLKMPTILINEVFDSDTLNAFVQRIKKPAVIIFDEFEKNLDHQEQEKTLTLLDGVYPCRHFFLLTCNDPYRVDSHLKNRPGRIFYSLKFGPLSEEVIKEYCGEHLKNELKHYVKDILSIAKCLGAFSFDQLQAVVEEMNRYDESPAQVMTLLNIEPEKQLYVEYAAVVHDALGLVTAVHTENITENPLTAPDTKVYVSYSLQIPLAKKAEAIKKSNDAGHLEYEETDEDDDDDNKNKVKSEQQVLRKSVYIQAKHFQSVDPENGIFVYKVGDVTVELRRKAKKPEFFSFLA